MTTYDLHDIATDERHAMPDVLAGLRQLLARIVLIHRRRQTVLRLSRLDAVQLADIGIELSDVDDARNGDGRVLWDKIRLR